MAVDEDLETLFLEYSKSVRTLKVPKFRKDEYGEEWGHEISGLIYSIGFSYVTGCYTNIIDWLN